MEHLIVFSDLDGTLLDHHSYSWEPARPALERMKAAGIPLILVSSKTRPEMEALRRDLGNNDPFIPENGAGVFIPPGAGLDPGPDARLVDGYRVLLLGRPRAEVAAAFDRLAARLPVRGLSRMSVEEVVRLTGLPPDGARAAREREFGEAFLPDGPAFDEKRLDEIVAGLGFRWTRGGRFYHLLGENDKGRAVRLAIAMYRKKHSGLVSAALGDAANDAPMLAVVDRPFLIAAPDGSHRPVDVPGLVRIPLAGPAGFNRAVMSLIPKE